MLRLESVSMKQKRSLRKVNWVISAVDTGWDLRDKLELDIECTPGPNGLTLAIIDTLSLN
jgi:hypothetical protein